MAEPIVKKTKTEGQENETISLIQSPYDDLYISKYSLPKCQAESINAVKISKDKRKLATCSSTGVIRIYNFEDGVLLATLNGHTKGVSDIAFSPINSDILASGSDDLTIRLWSISQRKCIRILKKHTYHITTVAFNSKGSMLISGAADETIVLWDLTSGGSLKTLAAHSDPVSSVCLTPDDTIIVSSSYDGLMRLFDTETGQCLKTLIYNSTSHGTATASTSDVVNFPISKVTISPNGKFILSSSLDGKIRLWDYMSNKVVKTYLGIGGNTPINNKYNSGSAFIQKVAKPIVASGSDSCGTLFWDLQTKAIVYQLQPGKTILDVNSIDGGSYLTTCSLSGEVDVYELNKKYEDQSSKGRTLNGATKKNINGITIERRNEDDSPFQSISGTPLQTPLETPVETPAETPTESPIETPIETPAETPAESREETPDED
ncbi:hypothetical protein JCM33374_g1153 [Metschnikowia sp. JCM 33374]|nr:hypothetical protein JCM33374_g1153 [Metschnikowia sp. JCM 33374]